MPDNKLKVVGAFSPQYIFDLIPKFKDFEVKELKGLDNKIYNVEITRTRYKVFKNSPKCVCCGLNGYLFTLHSAKLKPNEKIFRLIGHLQYYTFDEYHGIIQMTVDHIVPRSLGGSDNLHNLQTMCSVCNNIKGNIENISYDLIRQVKNQPMDLAISQLKQYYSIGE